MEVKQIGNLTENAKRNNSNTRRVYYNSGLAPTLTSGMGEGGNLQPFTIVAMRGRNPENPSDRTAGNPTGQRLEPNSQGICNTLTSVQKDNMVLERLVDLYNSKIREDELSGTITSNGNISSTHCGTFGVITIPQYRIRKLTPLECWRLMGFSDKDFLSAKLGSRTLGIKTLDKFPDLGVEVFADIEEKRTLSNSQAYKQAGNSIVKPVLMAILGQLIPSKEDVYKEHDKC